MLENIDNAVRRGNNMKMIIYFGKLALVLGRYQTNESVPTTEKGNNLNYMTATTHVYLIKMFWYVVSLYILTRSKMQKTRKNYSDNEL